jgi:hypothetical protein
LSYATIYSITFLIIRCLARSFYRPEKEVLEHGVAKKLRQLEKLTAAYFAYDGLRPQPNAYSDWD